MPTWNDIQKEVGQRRKTLGPQALDIVRRERIARLFAHTGRPVIIYAVDFLHQSDKTRVAGRDIQIDLADKEGFIEIIRDLPAGPLDLVLHSPGGNPLATESIISLLRSKFDNIRVFVPNVAKSAATMIALGGDIIAMDERGELGPIDPQMVLSFDQQIVISPAQAILDQFERARSEVQSDPGKLPGWLPMLRQYGPSLLIEAQNAIDLSKKLVRQWLIKYMLKDKPDVETIADSITAFFGEFNNFQAHGRMVSIDDIISLGIKTLDLRKDRVLGDLVWEVYTAIGITFASTGAYKLIENNLDQAFIKIIQQIQVIGSPLMPQIPSGQGGIPSPSQPALPPSGLSRQQRRAAERASNKRS